jgi:hypothetical protein
MLPVLHIGYTTEELGPTGSVANAGLGAEWFAHGFLSHLPAMLVHEDSAIAPAC